MERGAQIGGKGLNAFRGRVRTITTEVSTGCVAQDWTVVSSLVAHRPRPTGIFFYFHT